jgi:hypothetical protein
VSAPAKVEVLEVHDRRWEDVQDELGADPYCTRGFLAASSTVLGQRPILIHVDAGDWSGHYVLLLTGLESDRWLARTPEYGGPWLRIAVGESSALAPAFRRVLDGVLRELGVVSEVSLFSVWLPHAADTMQTCGARPEKQVCVAEMATLDHRWSAMKKGRRSDITRAIREMDVSWCDLDASGATAFAAPYEQAMEAKDAAPRWRLDASYFTALAEEQAADIQLCSVASPEGGAMGLFLRSGRYAAYLYATRWGMTGGASSAVLWHAQQQLADNGVDELLLGGGVSTDPEDSLLTFKRSLSDRVEPFCLASRGFDIPMHDAAVVAGLARPLPAGVVIP